MPLIKPDILVIGLDPAGIECALGAALAGVPVALVTQGPRGLRAPGGNDTLNRIRALGGTLIDDEARFRDHRHVQAGPFTIAARRIVLAQPARRADPEVAGLEAAPRWASGQPGKTVLVFGGAGEAVALAAAARTEGHRAILVCPGGFLPTCDAEARDALAAHLRRTGIEVHEAFDPIGAHVDRYPEGYLLYPREGAPIGFTHWASALEAPPMLEGLALEEAGVALDSGRPRCAGGLVTTNSRVFALGGTRSFEAHASTARAEAAMALAVMLARANDARAVVSLPRVVPGPLTLLEAGARAEALAPLRNGLRYYRQPLKGGGFVKIVTDKATRPLAITILGQHAAGLAAPLLQALSERRPLASLAGLSLPSLAEAEVIPALGRLALAEQLSKPIPRLLLRLMRALG